MPNAAAQALLSVRNSVSFVKTGTLCCRRRTGNRRRKRQRRARPSRSRRLGIRRTKTRARRALTRSETLLTSLVLPQPAFQPLAQPVLPFSLPMNPCNSPALPFSLLMNSFTCQPCLSALQVLPFSLTSVAFSVLSLASLPVFPPP